jgi:hypothetical protein
METFCCETRELLGRKMIVICLWLKNHFLAQMHASTRHHGFFKPQIRMRPLP